MDMGIALSSMRRNGVSEWIFQRISNIAIISWFVVYTTLVLCTAPATYESWIALHSALWFKVFSTLVLILACFNSILAGWQIGTDYIQKVPFTWFGSIYYAVCFLFSSIYLAGGLYLLWVLL